MDRYIHVATPIPTAEPTIEQLPSLNVSLSSILERADQYLFNEDLNYSMKRFNVGFLDLEGYFYDIRTSEIETEEGDLVTILNLNSNNPQIEDYHEQYESIADLTARIDSLNLEIVIHDANIEFQNQLGAFGMQRINEFEQMLTTTNGDQLNLVKSDQMFCYGSYSFSRTIEQLNKDSVIYLEFENTSFNITTAPIGSGENGYAVVDNSTLYGFSTRANDNQNDVAPIMAFIRTEQEGGLRVQIPSGFDFLEVLEDICKDKLLADA